MNILSSMKKIVPILLSAFTALNLQAQTATLDIDASQKGVDISPNLYGIFYEEINHAGEGGLYAELIQNRSFEEVDRGIPNRRFDNGRGERFGRPANPNIIPYWSAVNGATMTVTTEGLLNEAQHRALLLTTDETVSKTNPAGIRNAGFWGIKATKGDKYTLTFWAKADAKKRIRFTAGLYADGAWKAQKSFTKSISEEWKKYKVVFKGKADADEAEFQLLLNAPGSVYLDMVSLFPPTFKNRPNGCRIDLAEKLAALHPTFMRFPGGCFVEGMSRETAYDWKRTIGPLEERPGHMNLNWGYPCTDGMGYHEYLQLAEDLGAEPLYVVNVGIWHGGYQPYDQIDEYIQNALDAIEYANGDASTVWGRKRIENGHKEPFNLRLIEVGNENYQRNPNEQSDHYAERYAQFYHAIKAKYPYVQLIGNVESWGTDYPTWRNENPVDLLDEHYYRTPSWFAQGYHHYDNYDRNGPKIYCGEYAVTSNCGEGNLQAALGEAIYMIGMENNSDVVSMASYAPIFVNIHDRRWMPDMIRFDAAESWASPSYYVQQLMATNVGTQTVKSSLVQPKKEKPSQFRVGVGSWNTKVEYKDLVVTDEKGTVLLSNAMDDMANWECMEGEWNIANGMLKQDALRDNCVSICSKVMDNKNYNLSVKARKIGGDEGFLVVFDYTGEGNYRWFNVAGWGNTQHAIECIDNGSKSSLCDQEGHIEDNRWYTIRIEVRNDKVRCFLDDQKIHDAVITTPDRLYANAEWDDATNELIVKVVNFGDEGLPLKMNIQGAANNRYSLTSLQGNALDENTKDEPQKVAPNTTTYSTPFNSGSTFYAPANSLSILRIK